MESSATQEVSCPACSARHRIKIGLVGKRARCTCGEVFVIPHADVARDPVPEIDLAPESSARSKAPAQPIAEPYIAPPLDDPYAGAEQQPIHAPPVFRNQSAADAALARGYNPAHQRVETEDEHPPIQPNIFLDLLLPVILIPTGIALCFVQAIYFEKDGLPRPFAEIAPATITGIIGSLVLMVGAVVAAGAGMGWVFMDHCGRRS